MPLSPPRACPCGGLIREGKCSKCTKGRTVQRTEQGKRSHRFYNKRIWRDHIQPDHLAAEPLCRKCYAEGLVVAAFIVDHIVPFKEDWELFIDPDNHQSLCERHHNRKSGKERWSDE